MWTLDFDQNWSSKVSKYPTLQGNPWIFWCQKGGTYRYLRCSYRCMMVAYGGDLDHTEGIIEDKELRGPFGPGPISNGCKKESIANQFQPNSSNIDFQTFQHHTFPTTHQLPIKKSWPKKNSAKCLSPGGDGQQMQGTLRAGSDSHGLGQVRLLVEADGLAVNDGDGGRLNLPSCEKWEAKETERNTYRCYMMQKLEKHNLQYSKGDAAYFV